MNEKIMARLRGSKAQYKLLFDGEDLPDLGLSKPGGLEHAHQYSPKEDPGPDGTWYYVELDEEQKEKMVDPYIEAANSGSDKIAQPEYHAINAVYKKKARQLILSRVNASARVGENGKTLLTFGEDAVTVSKVSFAIDFSGEIDAYYDGEDRIYFTKFSKAKALFRDFDEFYQEAWEDDKEEFLASDLFAVSEVTSDDITPAMTQQIADIRANHKLDLDNDEVAQRVRSYARAYPLSGVIVNNDGKIKVATKDDLRCTIKLLTQRYFTSEITGEVFEARGSNKMTDQKAPNVFNGQEYFAGADMK